MRAQAGPAKTAATATQKAAALTGTLPDIVFSPFSLPVFGEGGVGSFLSRVRIGSQAGAESKEPHPALPELGKGKKSGLFFDGEALFLHQALQFAGLEHLTDDVAAADEFALHVELG